MSARERSLSPRTGNWKSNGKNCVKCRDPGTNSRIAELKLITPHYQHVEGTSFAAPIVASAIACMLEANPALAPLLVRTVLKETAHPVRGADRERQGAGALSPGQAVALALAERHSRAARLQVSPCLSPEGITFSLHDLAAMSVQVLSSSSSSTLSESAHLQSCSHERSPSARRAIPPRPRTAFSLESVSSLLPPSSR